MSIQTAFRTLALIALTLPAACSMPPFPVGSLEELYPQPPRPTLETMQVMGAPLAYARMEGTGSPPVLFIHGSPGDWKAWAKFLSDPALAGLGTRVAVDRPGFGGSAAGGVVTSLASQAERIGVLADPAEPALLVGHSLGGSIALRLAIDHPDRVRGVLLVASSVSSRREGIRWYNRAAGFPGATLLLSPEMLRSNQEMLVLESELQHLEADLPRLRCPVLLVQGQKDTLVDPRSADDFAQLVAPERLRVLKIPDKGHFVLWTDPGIVTQALLDLARWAAATPATAAAPSPG